MIGSPDDFGFETRQNFGQRALKDRSCISAIANQLCEKRELAEQCGQQRDAPVTILDIGGMNMGVQQETLCIDQDVPLLALDQFPRVEAGRIDAGPPFSALFTLWLSMMQRVGLASRSTRSRHLTYRAW